MISSPITADTKLFITDEGELGLTASYSDGRNEMEIAIQSWGADPDHFRWLVRSAADFHGIEVEERKG